MRLICTVILICGVVALHAQFGVRAGYSSLQIDSDSDESVSNLNAYHIGLNYWYRLKNVRVEFFPEVSYQNSVTADIKPSLADQAEQISIRIPIQFYPFDFISDCSCPTFSKQSRTFQKGFFLLISGGYSLDITKNSFSTSAPLATVGAGFDVGINDLLTLSPIIEYGQIFRPTATYSQLDQEWRAGIRVSFRPDYRRPF